MLQDVDVTDLQPGLGRDLVNGPTFDIPAVDDVRLAQTPASSRLPHHFAPGFQFQPARANFHLTYAAPGAIMAQSYPWRHAIRTTATV